MSTGIEILLQQGLRDHSWNAVIEQLRKSTGASGTDPAQAALDQLREQVRDLVVNLSNATSVGDTNKTGKLLNDRIEMMKGLEAAMAEDRVIAASSA